MRELDKVCGSTCKAKDLGTDNDNAKFQKCVKDGGGQEFKLKICDTPCKAKECKDEHGKVRYWDYDRSMWLEDASKCVAKHRESGDVWCQPHNLIGPAMECCDASAATAWSISLLATVPALLVSA